jgi:alkanesulfonate monooxygenase SsuD/methylene tetrahydromethanopterin reductase-like flavin-dependent oxidoreductase (luciferase family)
MKWSALDQSPVSEGRGEDQAIRDSLVLAQDCERLGYERFWSAAQVAGRLLELGERLELDEIVINTWTYDPEARRHSYALLAETFGLHAGCE